VILGRHASAELLELLDYVQAQSPRNANLVAERITKAVERIARDPETRTREPDVPGLPAGLVARGATVSGYTIRWVYPFVVDGEPNVLVVSIRRGSRRALDDPAYLLRWLEERAGQHPWARGELSEKEAMDLAVSEIHASRRRKRASRRP
jgi:plasmid stabilization system protein ParE